MNLARHHQRLQQALRSRMPLQEARELAIELVRDGKSPDDVLQILEDCRADSSPDDSMEDILLDVMDLLVGWCRNESRIPEHTPST